MSWRYIKNDKIKNNIYIRETFRWTIRIPFFRFVESVRCRHFPLHCQLYEIDCQNLEACIKRDKNATPLMVIIWKRKWTPDGFSVSTITIDSPINISTHACSCTTDKLAVLRRVGEQHESYQRVCITASINNAILTSNIRELYVDTCERICTRFSTRTMHRRYAKYSCEWSTVVNTEETGLAELISFQLILDVRFPNSFVEHPMRSARWWKNTSRK